MHMHRNTVGRVPAGAALQGPASSLHIVQMLRCGQPACISWRHPMALPRRSQRGPAVICAREPPRMRSLRGGGGSAAAQPQYGSPNGVPLAPGERL